MATLQTAALNLLRLAGFQTIRSGMQAVILGTSRWRPMRELKGMVTLATRSRKRVVVSHSGKASPCLGRS